VDSIAPTEVLKLLQIATGAFIHARAAEAASNGGPINAEAVIGAIPRVISQLIK